MKLYSTGGLFSCDWTVKRTVGVRNFGLLSYACTKVPLKNLKWPMLDEGYQFLQKKFKAKFICLPTS